MGKSISNSAYYAGEATQPENTDTSTMTLFSTSGGGSTTKSSVTVYKKSKDTGAALDTAAFTLRWLRGGDPNDAVFVRTLSTSGGSVVFRGLTRGETYTITETSAPNGYLLDDPAPITVVAPLTGTGDAAPVTVYNTPVKTGSWSPAAVKKLDGKSILHTFDFEIGEGTTPLLSGTTQTALANGDDPVAFSLKSGVNAEDVLTFTDDHIFADTDPAGTEYLASTKTFYMKEIPSDLPGYGFDPEVYTLVVKVFNVKGRDSLKVVVEDGGGNRLSDDSGRFSPDGTPVFTNTYRADGGIQLSAGKTVTGHALAAGQFRFELYEGSTLLQTAENGAGALTGADTYTGNVNFDVIDYTQADVGTKTYRIVEKNTGLPGYTYDPAEYTVTVKIDDNDDGTLTSSIQSIRKTVGAATSAADSVEFANTYTTSDVDVSLTASKTLSGRAIAQDQFSFQLTQVDPSGALLREIGTAKNDGETVSLPQLTFTQSDIGSSYYYQVSEVDGGLPGYTYDSSVYTVKIEIVDNDDGTISAAQTITEAGQTADAIAFANSYRASGETTIAATKTLTGKALPDGQFGFSLQPFDDLTGSAIGTATVVRNAADGEVVFPELSFTQEDAGQSFYYKIAEINEGVGGYTYDDTVYTVRVTVADNGDGTLDVRQQITEPSEKTEISFANAYTASDTFARLTANKVLNGRPLSDQQFTFVLNEVTDTGEPVREIQRVKNGADGAVAFDDLAYTQADMGKTYYYTISEAQDGNPGYAYDSTVYTVKVEITDNNDGTLTAGKTVLKGTDPVLSALFTNSYTTTDAAVQITAEKTLTGRELADGQFKYSLTLQGDDAPVEEATNRADGSIRFSPLTYTQADMGKTFTYAVKEIDEAKPGYEYDNTVYTVTVKVIDNGDGTLRTEVAATRPGDGGEAVPAESLVFSNVYTAEGSVQFTARKELIGQTLSDRQFAFALTDEAGNLLQTVANDADGKILFDKIFFDQDQLGEYRYRIYEVPGEQEGVTYDKTVYFLTVVVTDNGDGTLNAAVSTQKETGSEKADAAEIAFVNQYQAPTAPSTTPSASPTDSASTPTSAPASTAPSAPTSAPKTGDRFSAFWYVLLAFSSLGIAALAKRKRRMKN